MLIGKGGETIRKMQQETNCRINLDKERSQPGGVSKWMVVEGRSQEDVEAALKAMDDVIVPVLENRREEAEKLKAEQSETLEQLEDGTWRDVFDIPPQLVGYIIGRTGETIRRLGEDHQSDVQILKQGSAENNDLRHVCMIKSGSAENNTRARKAVEELLRMGEETVKEHGVGAGDVYMGPTVDDMDKKGKKGKKGKGKDGKKGGTTFISIDCRDW